MKEILFRGTAKCIYNWDGFNRQSKVKDGDIVEGHYYTDVIDNEDSDTPFTVHYIRIKYGDHYSDIEVIPETVCQYIGLDDKNGVKIFERAVIRSYDSQANEIKHVISYCNDEASFVAQLIPYNEINSHCGITQKWINEFDKEVIGNIHEVKND